MPEDRPSDPMRAAQANMRAPVVKRFYAEARAVPVEGGFALQLDGRMARTPGKAALILPSAALGDLVAAEWAAQLETIKPETMPITRLVNSALDGVANTIDETRAEIVRYAGSDLVCYRAAEPAKLVAAQAAAWDPALDFAARQLGHSFATGAGIVHVAQSPAALAAFAAALEVYSEPIALAALSMLTSLSGSALIAFMLARGGLTAAAAWAAAHVDEDYQIGLWGEDHEAAERRHARWRDFEAAATALAAL